MRLILLFLLCWKLSYTQAAHEQTHNQAQTSHRNWYGKLRIDVLCPDLHTRFANMTEALQNHARACSLQILKYLEIALPDDMSSLKKLKFLNLSRLDLDELPESIGRLSSLKRLNLRFNRLHELPESLGNLKNLQILDLTGNRLDFLPENLGQLIHLQWLSLKHNNFSEMEKIKIKNMLPKKCRVEF